MVHVLTPTPYMYAANYVATVIAYKQIPTAAKVVTIVFI